MKKPMLGSLIWYVLGVLMATCPWTLYETIFDPRPVFISLGSSPPDFWTNFWNNLPNDAAVSVEISGLVIFITTPFYLLFRFCFRCSSCPLIYIFAMACLTGAINFSLIFYVLTTSGRAVKSVYGQPLDSDYYLRSFMDAGGYWLLPFITTLISFLPGLLVCWFFSKRTIS